MTTIRNLTPEEAYAAMFSYLEHLYALTKSDDIAGFLGSMSMLSDGKPADPAVWTDWLDAIRKVIEGKTTLELKL